MVSLKIPFKKYTLILEHLALGKSEDEQAAFIFCKYQVFQDDITFTFEDWYPVPPSGFAFQSSYHIELRDEVKALVIQKAHKTGCAIVEVHSHVDQKSARFSGSDWSGFEEFVPHMLWRLKNRPYMALVFAPSSFDALAWTDKDSGAKSLESIKTETLEIKPTQNSISDYLRPPWKDSKDK